MLTIDVGCWKEFFFLFLFFFLPGGYISLFIFFNNDQRF